MRILPYVLALAATLLLIAVVRRALKRKRQRHQREYDVYWATDDLPGELDVPFDSSSRPSAGQPRRNGGSSTGSDPYIVSPIVYGGYASGGSSSGSSYSGGDSGGSYSGGDSGGGGSCD